MADTIFTQIVQAIKESKSSIELFLASGRAKDMETYWRLVGKYEALNEMEDAVKYEEKKYIDN